MADLAELLARIVADPRDAYDLPEAAKRACCSQQTIRDAITGGDLVAYHPHKNGVAMQKYLIRPHELIAWIERGERS